jgi:Mu transposase, C-terminal domain
VLTHYGVIALPCRVADPDRKGKVESAIAHTQRALKGLRFELLDEAQAYLDRWDARWADTRIHGITKRQVAAMFAEEQPALLPLPIEPFRYYQFGTRTVHLDGCVEVEYAYYAPPPGWLGQEVSVQWDGVHVRILHPTTGELLREHRRHAPGRRAIHPADRPTHTPSTTLALLARALRAGPHVGTLCETIHRRDGEAGVRRILGVLSLVKKYGAAAVEDACAAALELQVADYRFVRRYLERQPAAPLTLRQVDPLIRDLSHYRDVIARKTQEERPT